MRKQVSVFLSQGLRLTAFFVAAAVFVFNLFYFSGVSYNNREIVTIHNELGIGGISLLLSCGLFAGLIFLRKYLEGLNEKRLFWCLSAVYCVAALYFILNVDMTLRADPKHIATAAEKLRSGNLDIFRTGYLNRYPHQIGMVLFDALLDLFSENHAIQFVVNFLFVLGTNYLLYSLSRLLFQDHFTNILTILLSFCFLPQFFHSVCL